MKTEKLGDFLKNILPSPFSIAVILTFISFILALTFTNHEVSVYQNFIDVAGYWENGFWELLSFTTQMMLILVLGHVLALSSSINRFIDNVVGYARNANQAVFIVTFLSLFFSFLNWGLGLILGAILARKMSENFSKRGLKLNYPLIGAAGYSGLMVWHGGLSGSAPLKIAEQGHFLADKIGMIPINETIFSTMNIVISVCLITILPVSMYFLSKRVGTKPYALPHENLSKLDRNKIISGAENLDYSKVFTRSFALIFLFMAGREIIIAENWRFVNLNFINFLLFGLALFLHGNIANFVDAVNKAIKGSAGILIQFPLYAGIMGIMKYSGLTVLFTDFFIQISTSYSFPILTFISAGIVNIFVPSGGGQWIVQGPVIVEAAQLLGIPISKTVMAFAYGDELTNMLQPFWALPLLGITGLKAKELIPYTLFLLLIGLIIFISFLIVF